MPKYTVVVEMHIIVDSRSDNQAASEVNTWFTTGVPSDNLTGCSWNIRKVTDDELDLPIIHGYLINK